MSDEKDWLVSDKTCKGCKYYRWLSSHSGSKCCDYTYITGQIRTEKPKDCTVKKKGRLIARIGKGGSTIYEGRG